MNLVLFCVVSSFCFSGLEAGLLLVCQRRGPVVSTCKLAALTGEAARRLVGFHW